MNTIKFEDKGNIKMIAHRGVSGLERENTCPAFVAAGVKSYYGIETDVHVTKDGKIIVIHDDDLMRVAGNEMVVKESNFDDLRAVRMKDIDGVTERADLFLPTLEEYISICKKYDKQAVLELKNPMQKEIVWKIADTTKALGWFERVTFISFAGGNLVYLHEKFPEASAQFLSGYSTEEEIKFVLEHRFDADFNCKYLTKEKVDILKSAGKTVNCWTVNTLEQARQMQEFGVDMITTNILE